MPVDEESDPEKKPLAKHVFAMESALNDLHGALEILSLAPPSPFDLAPVGDAVAKAAAHLCGAFDDARDPLGAVRAAVVDLDEARLALDAAPKPHPAADVPACLDKARGWLVVAEERHARIKPSPTMALPPISGMTETLGLHAVERPTIAPVAKVPKPKAPPGPPPPAVPPKPKTIAELKARMEALKEGAKKKRAEVRERRAKPNEKKPDDAAPEIPAGFVKAPGLAMTQKQFAEARARDLFEEVTMLGIQRLPLLGDSWRVMAEFDRRMFAAIDAIVAFGPHAISHVERLVMDAPAKDPSRAFAIAVILGSVSGRDALAAVTRAFAFLGPEEPGVQQSLASALKLVPHPDLVKMLRFWLEDSRAPFRAVATEVLAFRSALTDDELSRAAHDPSPLVKRVALRPMAFLQSPLLREACDEALAGEDLPLAEAAFWAMAFGGVPNARTTLAKELAGPRAEEVALPLALLARAEESEALTARLVDKPTPALANAVGWAGDPRAFPALLRSFESATKS